MGSGERAEGMGPSALAREVGHGLMLLGLTGSSVGGVVGVVALATRLLGR
ncbi:MAG: hypothetical protein ABR529_00455 [Actinomycetota bacterium]